MEKRYPFYWSSEDRVFEAKDPSWTHQLHAIMNTPHDARQAVYLLNVAIHNEDANLENWKGD